MKKKALGKGLDALIGGGQGAIQVQRIPVDAVEPNPYQPRTHFPENEIEELAATIKEKGVLQPILVRPHGRGYQLVSGERRLRAAKKAGLKVIPAVVRAFTQRDMLEVALVENLQRSDLNPIEEATAYERLMKEFGYTQEEVAQRVGKSRSAVANILRLLRLPREVRKALAEGEITEGHARALLSLGKKEEILKAFRRMKSKRTTVREVERTAGRKRDPNIERLEKRLQRHLGLPVRVTYRGGKGSVTVRYSSLDELDALLERLGLPREFD